jgi:DNA helicase-2/ATP-dependent DNA helicase PcrA
MIGSYSGTYGVIGPPGSGKTTFLASQVRKIVEAAGSSPRGKTPVLVSSLTNTAAAEIGGRGLPLPDGAVGTLHSHAFRALDRPEIATGEVVESWNARMPEFAFSDSGTRVSAKTDDLDSDVVDDATGDGPGDEYRALYDLIRARRIERDQWDTDPYLPVLGHDSILVRDFARFVDEYEEWKTASNVFDFTDLISGAIGVPPPLDPEVFVVDEVQDLSALEWDLVRTWSDGKTLFAVGDPWQSLYEWRGAHPELFDSIPEDRTRTLSRSYRVPRRIVATALAWMEGRSNVRKRIEYSPRLNEKGEPVEGRIEFSPDWTPANAGPVIDQVERTIAAGKTAMIAATCSYMLIGVVAELRDRGIPFANPWRQRRGDWNPIATKGTSTLARFAAFLAPAAENRFWTWQELALWSGLLKSTGTFARGGKGYFETKAKEMGDITATTIEISPYLADGTLFETYARIRGRGVGPETVRIAREWFADRCEKSVGKSLVYAQKILSRGIEAAREKPRVYVGTVHSFKGAEADEVFLYTELSNRASAAIRSPIPGRDAIGSVARVFYVGMTRAKERLVVCGSSNKIERTIFSVYANIRDAASRAGVR